MKQLQHNVIQLPTHKTYQFHKLHLPYDIVPISKFYNSKRLTLTKCMEMNNSTWGDFRTPFFFFYLYA